MGAGFRWGIGVNGEEVCSLSGKTFAGMIRVEMVDSIIFARRGILPWFA